VNGQLPPHQFVLATDVNPNSPTFNQTTYYDYGPTASCPANTYFNVQQSQSFTRNNCGTGYIGGTVTYTVPPGAYGSTISQAAADQLATNDMNANGQNYANANGQCISAGTISYTRDVSESVTAKYTNNATGTVYNLHLLSSGTFSIPAGTYTVTITVFGSASYFISLGCTSNAGFSPITFYNVNVSSSSCNSLSVSYDY
jgi:hypothetical protein